MSAQDGTLTFPSPGSQTICSTTTTELEPVTASDGVVIAPYLRLSASCLDTDLALLSLNSPASFRKPTFCYNNFYFPNSFGYPLAVSRNSTANSGGCNGAESHVICDFTQGVVKPKGLSFIVCDVDNPYDSVRVEIYSGGALVPFNYTFMEPNPDSSYVFSDNMSGTGTSVHFNGGANGVWGESSKSVNWEKGAVQFNVVDANIEVDSVVLTHIIRSNRNDINAAVSIGHFLWTTEVLPVKLVSFNAVAEQNDVHLEWTTALEINNLGFDIEHSIDGVNWSSIGYVKSQSEGKISDKVQTYDFTHTQASAGRHYYRLKQTDVDQHSEYSYVQSVWISQSAQVQIYPNPHTGIFKISGVEHGDKIIISDILGNTVYQAEVTGVEASIDLSKVNAGHYHVAILTAGQLKGTYKVIKL